tara:strand:+ start:529 stop:798 length:270 start_codon:yes stop_codon:yes gene_type:complete
MSSSDGKLLRFLQDLTGSLERDELNPRQLQCIGEFFMSYQFQEQAIQDNDQTISDPLLFSKDELLKFLSLGWYVYQILLRKENLPNFNN